jgi:hypothetical protein
VRHTHQTFEAFGVDRIVQAGFASSICCTIEQISDCTVSGVVHGTYSETALTLAPFVSKNSAHSSVP